MELLVHLDEVVTDYFPQVEATGQTTTQHLKLLWYTFPGRFILSNGDIK